MIRRISTNYQCKSKCPTKLLARSEIVELVYRSSFLGNPTSVRAPQIYIMKNRSTNWVISTQRLGYTSRGCHHYPRTALNLLFFKTSGSSRNTDCSNNRTVGVSYTRCYAK